MGQYINCDAIRTLGIFNSYDTGLEDKLNFLDKLKCLKGGVKTWEHRGLSLAGKILIFKSRALSKLLYVSTMKCQSRQILDQLSLMHKNFIWNDKKPKIKHSTPIADYSEGCYKDVDTATKISALKVPWITRLSLIIFATGRSSPIYSF